MAKTGAAMSNTRRVQDGEKVLGIVAKLARKEWLSESERADLEAALTPVIRPLAGKAVWRRGLRYGAYEVMLSEAVQESWVITLRDILPRFDRERGNLFAFVRRCLCRRLINWLKREQNNCLHQIEDPNEVADTRIGDDDNDGSHGGVQTLIERALRAASIRDRRIFGLRMSGTRYAEIARELNMTEVAVRGVVFRLLNRVRRAERKADS
jgi:RNA polymerase sigma factor (sigma-70 family)